jgi:osmotically-inducible protein OsmY
MQKMRTVNGWAVAGILALAGAACERQAAPDATAPQADARQAEAPQVTAGERGMDQSPAWITTKIQAQYFTSPEIKPWNIDVTTTSDGAVTLRGEVDSADDRAEAVRIAKTTEGVTRVEDRLRIQGEQPAATTGTSTGDAGDARAIESPDAWVTSKIQAKYFTDPDVKGLDIDVTTRDGVVTLEGQVDTPAERRQAVAIARNTDGAREVNDQLQVRGGAEAETAGAAASGAAAEGREAGREAGSAVNDTWITTKIQSKYFLDAEVKGHEIDVNAQNGVVTLTGTVASEAQKEAAAAIARETEGVTRVENQLTVSAAQGQQER